MVVHYMQNIALSTSINDIFMLHIHLVAMVTSIFAVRNVTQTCVCVMLKYCTSVRARN